MLIAKKHPKFKIYLKTKNNVFKDLNFNNTYILDRYLNYTATNNFKKNKNLIEYKIECLYLPDGFIEDIRMFEIDRIELIEEQEVISDNGPYERTIIYKSSSCPTIDIIESCEYPNTFATITVIITTCWFRK